MKNRWSSYAWWGIIGVLLLCLFFHNTRMPLFSSKSARAQAEIYNTTFLTDEQLEDYGSMSEDEIRKFLVQNNSYFAGVIEDVDGVAFDPAEVIANAALANEINPQVILTTLQKENSGVTQNSRPSDGTLKSLMGCGPASTGRDQLACAAEYFRAYHNELEQRGVTRSGWKVGEAKNTQDNVLVTPANKAVAGQLTYTPYAGTEWGGQQVCNGGGPCGGIALFHNVWDRFDFDGSNIAVDQPPLAGGSFHIGIEAGHGNGDPGSKSCDELHDEADVTRAVADKVKALLEDQGISVDIFRSHDANMNGYKADAFVFIHNDWCAQGATGYKVSRHLGNPGSGLNGSGDSADQLAQAIWDEYDRATGMPKDISAGRYTLDMIDYYGFNTIDSTTPAAIIEMGFWSGDEDALLNRQDDLASGIAAGIGTFLGSTEQEQGFSNTSTIFVTDISGSMGYSWQGGVKIESAKEAALQLTNILERESQISNSVHEAGLVTFSSGANLLVPNTSDFTAVKDGILAMRDTDGTNMGEGLVLANQVASTTSSQSQNIMIILSDGMSNEGMDHDQIVSGPARAAGQAGTCIYAIGFGDPGDLDEPLLKGIVVEGKPGCSEYFYAADKFNLENIYIQSRHDATGDIIGKFSGQIAQDEEKQIGTFIVPPGQGELHSTLDWPGSELELVLYDPSGKQVTDSYPGATLTSYSDLAYWIVTNPAVGEWSANAVGVEVPEGIIDYEAITSVRARTQLIGDFDGDGLCTESDALIALQMAVGLLDLENILDINSDSRVTELDALMILNWAVKGGTCGP